MNIFCAWCGKYMGKKDGEGIEGESHSVCESCYEKLIIAAKTDSEKQETTDAHPNTRRTVRKS